MNKEGHMKQKSRFKFIVLLCILGLAVGVVVMISASLFQIFSNRDSEAARHSNPSNKQSEEVSTQQSTVADGKLQEAKTELQMKDFSVKLFQKLQKKDKNTLVSPISVLYALAVVGNGADGNTKDQFQKAVGIDFNQWNAFLLEYQKEQSTKAKGQLKLANSIWVNDDAKFKLNTRFQKTMEKNFQTEIYASPFNKTAMHKMNDWVDKNTDHLIPSIIDKLNKEDMICAINAVAFKAQWENIYTKDQVRKSDFTKEDNTTQQIKMMYQKEDNYIKGTNETGFIKYYANKSFAFVAIMPNEGIKLSDYIKQLNGIKLNSLFTQSKQTTVDTGIPKFKATSEFKLVDTLKELGIQDAFDANKADFSKMGQTKEKGFYIGNIIHKTHIAVDEKGTKAGAATAVIMEGATLQENPQVYLNRPFLYFIIDAKTNTPIFMGSIYDVN